jgi:tetratricopeptide (TPR) repeat protein
VIERPLVLGLVVVVVSALVAAPARADVSAARAHYERGQALYQVNEFQKALEEFKAAHVEKPDPAYLFNIAQCYRQMGDRANALTFYRRYLSLAPDSPLRPEVERHIVELEIAQPRAPTPSASPPEPESKPRARIKMDSDQPSAVTTTKLETAPTRATPLPGWLPAAAAGVTVVLAATAIAFGVTATGRYDSLRGSCGSTAAGCSASQIDTVTSPAHAANVFWILTGLAAVGTGVSAYVNAREGGISALWRF